jgi:hypothetical protein
MINIEVTNGIASFTSDLISLSGKITFTEIVDDDFVHITIGGSTIGFTPSDTNINGEHLGNAALFFEKVSLLISPDE